MEAQPTKRRIAELERCFKEYPDVPREVIVKEDLLNEGVRFSDAALEATEGSSVKVYTRLFSHDTIKMDEMKRQEHLRVPHGFSIEGGPYYLQPTEVRASLSGDSPYLLDVIDGKLVVCEGSTQIAEVTYPPAPKYYAKSFEDGTAYREIAPMASSHTVFITVFRYCQFWGSKEECKFCDINENARQAKISGKYTLTAPVKKLDQVVEACEYIVSTETDPETRPTNFILSGGAITKTLHGIREDDFYLRYVEAIKDRIGHRWALKLQTVAKDKETLKRYRASGVDIHNANIEVWDRDLFRWICPGKDKLIGRDEWIRRVIDSVDVFGEGYVTPNLVCGVEMAQPYGFKDVKEAVKSTSEGFEYLMSHGVVPRLNHWSRPAGSAFAGQPPPPLDFYIQIVQARYEIWKKYNLPPSYRMPVGPGRGTTGNGAWEDIGP